MTVTFDTETIRLITLFENITGAPVRDCLSDDKNIYFVIDEGKVGLAIGKNGNNVKHAESMINKSIKIFEFSNNAAEFTKNLIPSAAEIKIRNGADEQIVIEIKVDKGKRAVVIGREGKNLKLYKNLLQRSHGVTDLIVR